MPDARADDTDRWPPSLVVRRETVASLPAPRARPLPARDRLEGMLLGLAIGDALGRWA